MAPESRWCGACPAHQEQPDLINTSNFDPIPESSPKPSDCEPDSPATAEASDPMRNTIEQRRRNTTAAFTANAGVSPSVR